MAPRKKKEESPLLSALKFVALAQRDKGPTYQTHCRIFNPEQNKTIAIAYDGILAVGVELPEELPDCCPNTLTFIHALERAKGNTATTITESQVIVKTSKFRAVVPSVGPADLHMIYPDPAQYPLNDEFKRALIEASALTKEGAQTVVQASVMTKNGSIVGTNGHVIIEAWHGIPTPPGLAIPKAFIQALEKVNKKIERFGLSDISFTVWFDDGSFIKTQLYSERWPDIDSVLNELNGAKPTEMSRDFWEGVKTVAPFSQDGYIYLGDGEIRSHRDTEIATSYKCKGVPDNISMNIRFITSIEDLIKTVDFDHSERLTVFFGDKIRGAMIKSS